MERERLKTGSRVLLVLLLTVFALPAMGATTEFNTTGEPSASASPGGGGAKAGPPFQKKIGKVAIVAQSGGDYTSPVTAMANVATWCGAPSETNPCLVKIMPGVYDLGGGSLTMQAYVDIEGSGETATIITSAYGSGYAPQGVVNGADNAELRFLTVRGNAPSRDDVVRTIANNGQSPKITNVTAIALRGGFGVYNVNSSPTMSNVTVVASGGEGNTGVYNINSSPTMSNVTVTASRGEGNSGVYNNNSSPTMNNVVVTVSDGSFSDGVYNYNNSSPTMNNVRVTASDSGISSTGVSNSNSSPTMSNVTVTVSGTGENYGVQNYSSSPTMSNVTARALNGRANYGLLNSSNSAVTILVERSTFEGSGGITYSVSNESNVTLRIGASKLVGTVANSGALACTASYNGDYVALGPNCQ